MVRKLKDLGWGKVKWSVISACCVAVAIGGLTLAWQWLSAVDAAADGYPEVCAKVSAVALAVDEVSEDMTESAIDNAKIMSDIGHIKSDLSELREKGVEDSRRLNRVLDKLERNLDRN